MIVLDPAALAAIRAHSADAYPLECCGAVVGTARGGARIVSQAWPLSNAAGIAPDRQFAVSASEYRSVESRADEEGVALLGFYHSHPDAPARPSASDLSQAWPTFDYIIVSVLRARPSDITCWRLRDDRAAFLPEEISWQLEF